MFVRRISVVRVGADGAESACPIRWIDNFAMRNFTNDAVFDDTLPVGDGLLEAGHYVPLERLGVARIFTPGASTTEIVAWVRAEFGQEVAESQA